MKKTLLIGLALIIVLLTPACSCSGSNSNGEDGGRSSQSNSSTVKDFELTIYSDKEIYKTTDKIQIWATLVYSGNEETVTIWHGLPSIGFSVSDGKDFHTESITLTVLTSTTLGKGVVYSFPFEKTGVYDNNAPNANFWKKYYSNPDLVLPAGEYTITVTGGFSLSPGAIDIGLSTELKIKVVK